MIYGVDVASYQGNPDWRSVYRSGIRFAFSKVTESTNYTNPTWAHNREGMLDLGSDFLPGAYHFLHGGNGAAQARHFVAKAGDLTGFAVALDVEASGADAATARDWVAEFKRLTNNHPVIGYYPRWYWDRTGRPNLSFFDTVWQSHYVNGTGTPAGLYRTVPESFWTPFGSEPISVLQFSSSGQVAGISGRCDVNAYRGSLGQLKEIALGSVRTEDEKEGPDMYVSLGAEKWVGRPRKGHTIYLSFDKEYADAYKQHGDGRAYPTILFHPSYYVATVGVVVEGLPADGECWIRFVEVKKDAAGNFPVTETDPAQTILGTADGGPVHVSHTNADTLGSDRRLRIQMGGFSHDGVTVRPASVKILAWKK